MRCQTQPKHESISKTINTAIFIINNNKLMNIIHQIVNEYFAYHVLNKRKLDDKQVLAHL